MRGHSSAIGHHHGLSRGRVPSPAEPSHPVENVIPAATPYQPPRRGAQPSTRAQPASVHQMVQKRTTPLQSL